MALTDSTDWEEIREIVTESCWKLAPKKLAELPQEAKSPRFRPTHSEFISLGDPNQAGSRRATPEPTTPKGQAIDGGTEHPSAKMVPTPPKGRDLLGFQQPGT